jgi:hypothetical protein
MWPRIVEILLGIWLIASPLIFRTADTCMRGAVNDLICGAAVIVLSLVSFSSRFRRAHFLILLVAAWLLITGYIAGHPAPPAAQNLIIVGLLLAMFAIIPGRINEMPESWRRFYAKKG